jgi:hypothetical protein
MWAVAQHLISRASVPSQSKKITAGDTCKVQQLNSRPELNGKFGPIGELNYYKGRWPVTIEEYDGKPLVFLV